MTTILSLLSGALIAGGLVLAVVGLTPTEPGPPRPPARLARRLRDLSRSSTGRRAGAAAGAGVVLLAVTGWPVLAIGAAAAVYALPLLIGTGRANAARIARLAALEDWTRRLADSMTAHAGLEQAIAASTRTAPAAIKTEIEMLASRLRAQWPTEDALRAFADDLASPTGDLIASALILGSRRRGAGLSQVLIGLAKAVEDEVAMSRRMEAERAKPRSTVRTVTVITVLMVVAFSVLNRDYLAPYGTPLGQIVLAVVISGFAGAIMWMHRATRPRPQPRFLTGGTGQAP